MSNPPTSLGQYQIIREIARSNDIVYEAYDPLMNRRCAIKELAMPPGATSQQQEERISRFKREAQAAGTLNHPNIMTVYSFAEDGGRTFMAMEYLDGCTLRNEIDTKGNLSLDRSIEVVTEVLAGLEHAHSKGVIHRDIKPDNIQILSSGGIKITDFGIARLTFQPNLTMDGQVFGTPSYMSPEQVVGREIDARSDLFSVGVMLYEMLSGHKPFAGDSVVSITYAIMNKEPDEPAQVPYPIWQVISRALDKTPAMRYQSAAEMSAALGQAAMAQQSGAMAMPSPTQVPPNPYQQTAQPIAPPIVYPFNPYQQAAPPPHPQPMYPGFPLAPPQQPGFAPQPIPIYYPPPPRRPLLPPESVIFLKRVVAAMIIIGTLFLLVIVGFMAAISAINSGAESKRVVMQQRAAQSYVAQAKKYLQVGQDIAAENSLNQAISANPKLVDAHINLAQLHQRGATAQTSDDLKLELWKQAAEEWHLASQYTDDAVERRTFQDNAANCYLNAAQSQYRIDPQNRQQVRDLLYQAQDLASSPSELRNRIDAFMATVQAVS